MINKELKVIRVEREGCTEPLNAHETKSIIKVKEKREVQARPFFDFLHRKHTKKREKKKRNEEKEHT